MTADIESLDAHEQPADDLRARWKSYSKTEEADLISRGLIDDFSSAENVSRFCLSGTIPMDRLATAFAQLDDGNLLSLRPKEEAPVYYHPLLPGLLILPSLLPPEVQLAVMDRLVHRDLSDQRHKTNLHLHYHLPYAYGADGKAASFFSYPPDSEVSFRPKDLSIHKPLSIKQVLERRLHWETLGGQYDWTNREYPDQVPPQFPADIASFLETLFPETLAQAAIVNFYTPGDTMMMHRDVSEETDKGLVSVSLGCDCLFMIAPNGVGKLAEEGEDGTGKQYLLLRLRSGDAIYMTKESRYAWHGVPKVLKGTCPDYLRDWPAGSGSAGGMYEEWRGWMANKRINLNVRQVKD